MMPITKIPKYVFFILLLVGQVFALGQSITHSTLLNYSWLDDKDQKGWEKQLSKIEEAEALMKSSNDLYIEANNVAANMDLSEKKRASTQASLEEKAKGKSIDALIKFKEAYLGIYNILENYIERIESNHPALVEYKNYQSQSDLKYNAAGKVKTPEEQKLLSEANENQLLAIERIIEGINTPASDFIPENRSAGNLSTEDGDILVDKEMYERYQAYINNEDIDAPIGLQQVLQMEGDQISVESFASLWDDYQSNEPSNLEAKSESIKPDSISEPVITAAATEIVVQEDINKKDNSSEQEMLEEIVNEETTIEKEETTLVTEENYVTGTLSSADYLEFRVQIAASKIPLNMAQVQAIYNGPLTLIEVKDGSYFRYQIKGFQLLRDAQLVCSQSDVNSAYLASYKNGQNVNLAEAAKENRATQKMVDEKGKKSLVDMEFAVQLAASRVRLKESQLRNIYNGSESVSIVFEEGWYKYQILSGNNLSKAYSILESVSIEKAFLVAYRNGKKLELYKALKEYKNHLP